MPLDTNTKGLIVLIIGILLLFIAASQSILELVAIAVALFLIDVGLRLRNMPSLQTLIYQWLAALRIKFFE